MAHETTHEHPSKSLALWLLLVSVLAHALLPAGSPLQRASGAAFSASTYEVSLAPTRADAELQPGQWRSREAGGSDGTPSFGGSDLVSGELPAGPSLSPSGSTDNSVGPYNLSPKRGAADFQARAPPIV